MSKNIFCTVLLMSLLFAAVLVQGCAKDKHVQAPPPEAQPQPGELLVSPQSLRQADLEIAWSYTMPLNPSERLRSFTILDNRLFAVSTRNYLVSLDMEKAEPAYSWQLAPPSATFWGLREYDGQLYSIVGAELVALDEREGNELMRRTLGFGPICPPARNNSFYYVPGTDQRVHVMRAANMVSFFEVSANDDGNITCVMADDDFVAFATDAGTLAAMMPDKPIRLWQFKAAAGINAPVFYDGRQLIFSSRDAYIYALDRPRGRLLWKYLTPSLLTDGPEVTRQYVYQHVSGHGLLVINRANGTLAWQLPEGIGLLAEDGRRVYIMAKRNKLVVMDNKSMKKLYEVEVTGVTHWVSNTEDGKIYLADDSGRIACIKPIEY
jgi:outer membrane protein assembly factor BamB